LSRVIIDRRRLLAGGVAAAAAAPAAAQTSTAPGSPAISRRLPDVVVVGAGAFGGWTALELRERGARVTLVDAYGPGNSRASSGGESRNLRSAYGDRDLYTRWAEAGWLLWKKREEEFGRQLVFPSGSFSFLTPQARAIQQTVFDRLKVPYEVLQTEEARRRWPQINFADGEIAFYEPRSGVVKANASMVAVAEAFARKGGEIRLGKAELGAGAGGRLQNILVNGERLDAGAFVFAAGPWLPKLLPQLLGEKIVTPRVELFFLGSAAGDPRYRWDRLPNITEGGGAYTSSDIGSGLKVRLIQPARLMDPDLGDRFPTHALEQDAYAYARRRMPGLVGQPVTATFVCQVEYTDNNHFLIDQHPDYANAILAGGGSGHAFKMGPVLGGKLADRVTGAAVAAEEHALFALAAHGKATGKV
jgi:glycine/D-amino acid oxidase-like deaminating enzyme